MSSQVANPEKNKPLIFKYQFKNIGDVFIRFKGTLNVIDKNNNVYGTVESKKAFGTLPENIREDTLKWFGSLPKGEYDIILTVDIGEDIPPLVVQKSIVITEDIQ